MSYRGDSSYSGSSSGSRSGSRSGSSSGSGSRSGGGSKSVSDSASLSTISRTRSASESRRRGGDKKSNDRARRGNAAGGAVKSGRFFNFANKQNQAGLIRGMGAKTDRTWKLDVRRVADTVSVQAPDKKSHSFSSFPVWKKGKVEGSAHYVIHSDAVDAIGIFANNFIRAVTLKGLQLMNLQNTPKERLTYREIQYALQLVIPHSNERPSMMSVANDAGEKAYSKYLGSGHGSKTNKVSTETRAGLLIRASTVMSVIKLTDRGRVSRSAAVFLAGALEAIFRELLVTAYENRTSLLQDGAVPSSDRHGMLSGDIFMAFKEDAELGPMSRV